MDQAALCRRERGVGGLEAGEGDGTVGGERGLAVRRTDIWESNALKRSRDHLSLSLRSRGGELVVAVDG